MLKTSYRYIFSGLIMFIGCMLVRLFLRGFICVVIQIIIGIILYFAVLIFLKDDYVYSFIKRMRVVLMNKLNSNK